MPLPIVSMTYCPCSIAPKIAKTETKITAFLKEMSPQPTDVPTQLAVSFAPIFHPTYAPAPNKKTSVSSIAPSPLFRSDVIYLLTAHYECKIV